MSVDEDVTESICNDWRKEYNTDQYNEEEDLAVDAALVKKDL